MRAQDTSRLALYIHLMRFDRPVGTLLLMWPTIAALWIASEGVPAMGILLVFIFGTITMRAAGCVINDFADRNIDRHVQRTQTRPLTSGTVSEFEALALFAILCTVALILVSLLNRFTLYFSVGGVLIAIVYPFMKRWTYMPQAVLGAAFSWGIPMTFAAVLNEVPPVAWLMFTASLLWIIAYDTLYAMVDREDDIKIGVKSTAILFGDSVPWAVAALQITTLGLFVLLAQNLAYGPVFYLALVVIAALFAYQQKIIRRAKYPAYFAAFGNNIWVGFTLFVGVVVEETLLPYLA